jgi:hypothetical protein
MQIPGVVEDDLEVLVKFIILRVYSSYHCLQVYRHDKFIIIVFVDKVMPYSSHLILFLRFNKMATLPVEIDEIIAYLRSGEFEEVWFRSLYFRSN